MNCNWKYIVDKIVCNNDQQASIFLQQKLKVGTPEQKYEIVEAIIAQAYPLMVNRFGNFLVQRCFEHGTPEQIIKIAEAIRGNTLNLSMDPFGCHVVQKAFDSVPEDYKAVMVSELLRRIPETVIHRYACHVWQKLFELRWQESPPQIMKYVNESLRECGMKLHLGRPEALSFRTYLKTAWKKTRYVRFFGFFGGNFIYYQLLMFFFRSNSAPALKRFCQILTLWHMASLVIGASSTFVSMVPQEIGAAPSIMLFGMPPSTVPTSLLQRLSKSVSRLAVPTFWEDILTEFARVAPRGHAFL